MEDAGSEEGGDHRAKFSPRLESGIEECSLPHRKRCFTQILLGNTEGLDMDGEEGDAHAAEYAQEEEMEEEGDEVEEEEEGEEEEEVEGMELEMEDGVELESLPDSDREETFGEGDEDDLDELRFEEGEMDPLALVEEDAEGKLHYDQFERLGYEALAARKRKDRKLSRQEAEGPVPKKAKYQDVFGASVEEIWDSAGFGPKRRRRREPKKRGRKKLPPGGVRLTPEVTKKLGDANLLYATGKFDEAIKLLAEVVKIAPYVPDSYHTYGLVYEAMGNRKKALSFYMLAAVLTPKDSVLWKRLATWSMEEGNIGQAIWCLTKAIRADPEDDDAKWDRAALYADLGDWKKAADSFEQLLVSHPCDMEICKMVAKIQHKNGNVDRATQVLENFLEDYPAEADLSTVNILSELLMRSGAFLKAISQIDQARLIYCPEQGLPLDLAVKAGICHAYLGNLDEAQMYFEDLSREKIEDVADLILEVGDAYLALEEHERALKYFKLLDKVAGYDNPSVWLKTAECHVALKSFDSAIPVYHQVVKEIPHHVEARLALSKFLCNHNRQDEAVALLVPPGEPESQDVDATGDGQVWWKDPKVKVTLADIFYGQGKYAEYIEAILPVIQETLYLESVNQKERQAKARKGLPKSVLAARVRLLDDHAREEVFQGFGNPSVSRVELAKAARAKRQLAKRAAQKEEKKLAAIAAGRQWASDEDSDNPPQELDLKVLPLPNLLKDDEHFSLLMQACKTLASLKRYWDALEIIHHTLSVGNSLAKEKRDELRSLGAQIAYRTRDVKHGYECVRYLVQQRPYSHKMWSCYYQVVSRAGSRVPKHNKFMLQMRTKYPDNVDAMMVYGHQFATISQPQGALREYLQAFKYQPDNPFVSLCIGVAFINLSLGFRLSNRNQTLLQGFAFLYHYQRLSKYSQESYYNLARAFHHVGFAHLAVLYYEKVLAQFVKDYPIVTLPHQTDDFSQEFPQSSATSSKHLGHCDLRREAAHNLHLLYRKSGAIDLARQILKDHCSF